MFYRSITVFTAAFLMMILSAGALTANAQQQKTSPEAGKSANSEIPDVDLGKNELADFVKAAQKVQVLQSKSQKKMIDAIKAEGLETTRFAEIIKMKKSGNESKGDFTKDELENFKKAHKKVEKIQKDLEAKQMKAIEKQGMEVERYVEIARAARQNPELGQKIRAELQK